MNFAKRLLMVSGAVMLAGIVGVLFTPKALHAVATAVNVVNQQSNPVPVREANSPDIYPFVLQFCTTTLVAGKCTFSGGSNGGSATSGGSNGGSATVPSTTPDGVTVLFADIDDFSANCTLPNNAVDQEVEVFTTFQSQGIPGSFDLWTFRVPQINPFAGITNQPTRIYADPGSTILVDLNGSIPQARTCAITLSGHLVTH